MVALDGGTLGIRTTVSEGYRFEGYVAVGVAPAWEGGDPSKAVQTVEVRGRAEIMALVAPVEHSVTVVGGRADRATARPGDTVTVTADAPGPGRAFVQWAHADGVDYARADALTTTFTMPARDVTVTAVSAPIAIKGMSNKGYTYTGKAIEPVPVVELEGVELELRKGRDYTLSYVNNEEVGRATVTVTMKDPRAGSATAEFMITKRPVSFAAKSETRTYTGSAITIGTVKAETGEGVGLVSGHTHNVEFSASGVDVGGPYEGTITAKEAVVIKNGETDVTANYDVMVTNGALIIEQDPDLKFKVSLEGASFVYDGKPHALPKTATADALSGTTTFEYTKKPAKGKPAEGDWTADLSSLTAMEVADSCTILVRATNPNYAKAAEGSAKLTIRELLTMRWLDGDGSVLLSKNYAEGDPAPAYDGKEPTKAATAQYSYKFTGWDGGTTEGTVTTYRPTFAKTPLPTQIEKGTLTFDLGGGTLDGKTGKITIEANVGDVITIPDAPVHEGYTFKYWKGSEYHPGDKYTVEGDHTFKAVWEKDSSGTSSGGNSSGTSSGGSSTSSSGNASGGNTTSSGGNSTSGSGTDSSGGGTTSTRSFGTTTTTASPRTGDSPSATDGVPAAMAVCAIAIVALGLRRRRQ